MPNRFSKKFPFILNCLTRWVQLCYIIFKITTPKKGCLKMKVDEKLSQLGLIISDLTIEIKNLKEKAQDFENRYWSTVLELDSQKKDYEVLKIEYKDLCGGLLDG